MSDPCDCGNGVVMWNERGDRCCSHTLERYVLQNGKPPLAGGVWRDAPPANLTPRQEQP